MCDFTEEEERRERERKEEEERKKRKMRGRLKRVIFVLLLFQIIMKAPLLPRGRTPVTLTVEEPRKFCVLFHLFHCTHRRFYNTLSAREALMSVESTTYLSPLSAGISQIRKSFHFILISLKD